MNLIQHIKEKYMTENEKNFSREMEYLTYVSEKNNIELKLLGKMMGKIYEILPNNKLKKHNEIGE